jgi:ABC-type branched-subunit amino acid transport system ATPase component
LTGWSQPSGARKGIARTFQSLRLFLNMSAALLSLDNVTTYHAQIRILVQQNFQIIKDIHASGVAVLVVERNAAMALSIADRGYVLYTGVIVLEGRATELLRSEDLKRAYLGR